MALTYKLPLDPADPEFKRFKNEATGELRRDVAACIMLMPVTGMCWLKTEKEAIEHWARSAFLSRNDAYYRTDEIFPVETALSLVGLHTNVSQETEASFVRRGMREALDNLRREAARKRADKTAA